MFQQAFMCDKGKQNLPLIVSLYEQPLYLLLGYKCKGLMHKTLVKNIVIGLTSVRQRKPRIEPFFDSRKDHLF